MAMTQLMLMFVGVLALFATFGLFYDFRDRWTGVLVGFTASILWGVFGISAFEVTVVGDAVTHGFEMMPLVIVGVGLAFVTALFALSDLLTGVGSEVRETNPDDVLGNR